MLFILLGAGVNLSFARRERDERKLFDVIQEAMAKPEGDGKQESAPISAQSLFQVGDPCPEIILNNVRTNKPTNLKEISKGKVTVIIYMQTSSAACRKELEDINALLAIFPELNVVAISVDAGNSVRILKYIEQNNFPFIFLRDTSFMTIELFGFSFAPATVILGKNGKIFYLKGFNYR